MAGLATIWKFDWPTLIGNVRREVDRLNGVYTQTLETLRVDRYLTRAVFEDAHKVRLANPYKTVTAKTILIATGGHPIIPDVPGKEHLISSNECFQLEALPDSIVIIGAGYISMEFASIFNGLGVHVTVLYRGDQILRDFDDDLRNGLAASMRKHGIDLRMNADVAAVAKEADGYRVKLKDGDSIAAGLVMAATGRAPNTMGLGLEAIGVELGWNGHIVVDEFSKSSVDNIYAVGDVTHRMNLTPVAIREANDFAETLFKNTPTAVDYVGIPTAVFSDPEIGTVGLSEAKAREMYANIDLYKSLFRPMKYTIARTRRQNADEARDRCRYRQSARLPYSRARRRRDRADGGDRLEDGGDQGGFRSHHGAASECRRRTRYHAASLGAAEADRGVRCGGLRTRSRW